MDEPETFTATCAWCRMDVISFAQQPTLVSVAVVVPLMHGQAWDVCLECYTELIKLVAARGELRVTA